MAKPIIIKNIISKYKKKIVVDGDKSLTIRFALLGLFFWTMRTVRMTICSPVSVLLLQRLLALEMNPL